MKIRMVQQLFWCLWFINALSCSDGSLDNNYDYYMGTFGLHPGQGNQQSGALLGRALIAGRPASWAKVHISKADETAAPVPFVATANDKGGFFLAGLEPGLVNVYITTVSGFGKTFQTTIVQGQTLELSTIELSPLQRITGKVTLMGEDAHGNTRVYIPGTLFAAFTGDDGSFLMDVPAGTYRFRAARDTFQTYTSDEIDCTGAAFVEMELSPLELPDAEITIQRENGLIVRSLTTPVTITPRAGTALRYMRVSLGTTWGTEVEGLTFGRWIPLQESFTLTFDRQGYRILRFEFRDAYGNTSEPIEASFYNSTLGPEWELIYGRQDKPRDFPAGSKIAFLILEQYGSMNWPVPGLAEDSDETGSSSGDAAAVPDERPHHTAVRLNNRLSLTDGSISQPTYVMEPYFMEVMEPYFMEKVTVGPGSEVTGTAVFTGGIEVIGESDEPVVWELTHGNSLRITGSNSNQFRHVRFANGQLDLSSYGQTVHFSGVEFVGVRIWEGLYGDFLGNTPFSHLTIEQSKMTRTQIERSCWANADEVAPDPAPNPEEGEEGENGGTRRNNNPTMQFNLSITGTVLSEASLMFNCSSWGVAQSITIGGNNFMNPPEDGFYWSSGYGEFPSGEQIRYQITNNYFLLPERISPWFGEQGWPSFAETTIGAPHEL